MHKSLPLLVATALFTALALGCGPSASATADATTASARPASPSKTVDAATAGSVSGKVTFVGIAPAPEIMRVAVDQTCIQAMGTSAKSDAILIGADGAIQNAFVYIKDTMSDYTFDVPSTPVVLDKKAAAMPRVFGVRGPAARDDQQRRHLHNVHAMPMVNQEFNRGMPQQKSP